MVLHSATVRCNCSSLLPPINGPAGIETHSKLGFSITMGVIVGVGDRGVGVSIGCGVSVGAAVFVGATDVFVGGTFVSVGGITVFVGGRVVSVGEIVLVEIGVAASVG